jgi:hypothetical protein
VWCNGLEDNGHLLNTKINAIPTAMSAPAAIHGDDRFGFDVVGMILRRRYSPRKRSECRFLRLIAPPNVQLVILPLRTVVDRAVNSDYASLLCAVRMLRVSPALNASPHGAYSYPT